MTANISFGQNMAYDGTYTYYNDGLRRHQHDLQDRLRPVPWSRRATRCPATISPGLAYLNGKLYGADVSGSTST